MGSIERLGCPNHNKKRLGKMKIMFEIAYKVLLKVPVSNKNEEHDHKTIDTDGITYPTRVASIVLYLCIFV